MNHSIFTALLLGAVCVLLKAQDHIYVNVVACQTNDIDPEDTGLLDGEEMGYINLKDKTIISTLPEFVNNVHFEVGWMETALGNHQACLNNLNVTIDGEGNPTEEIDGPRSTIYPLEEVELGKNNSLICFVNNFNPPPVEVKWTKNDVEVKSGVTLSRYYPNPDFTFHQFSTLSISPREGDVYHCSVEHKGLEEPQIHKWVPPVNQADMAATAFCGIGLTLGLLGVGVGTFFLIKGNNCN